MQVVGAAAWGPNTVYVIVPLAPLAAPDSAELIELAKMAVPEVSAPSGLTVSEGAALPTTVEAMPEPHVLAEDLSPASPP